MAEKITIKAAPGRNVRDPNNRNRVLPADGIKVSPTDPYWFLKLKRGDVVIAPPQKTAQAAATPAAAPASASAAAPASPPAAPVSPAPTQPQTPVKPAVTGTATQSAE